MNGYEIAFSLFLTGLLLSIVRFLWQIAATRSETVERLRSVDVSLKQIVGLLMVRLPEPSVEELNTKVDRLERQWSSLDLQEISKAYQEDVDRHGSREIVRDRLKALDDELYRLEDDTPGNPLTQAIWARARDAYRQVWRGGHSGEFLSHSPRDQEWARDIYNRAFRRSLFRLLSDRGHLDRPEED